MSPCLASKIEHMVYLALSMSPIPSAISHSPGQFSSIQFSRTVFSDSATPGIAARQASLSITTSQSLLKLTSIESVMPSSHLILCRPLLLLSTFPSIRVFSNESALPKSGQSIGASASASILPMNLQT